MNKKIRFNVLDFSIVLLSVLSILAIVFWNDIRVAFMYEEVDAEYTFLATGVTEEMLVYLTVGEDFVFSEDGKKAGTITYVESEKELSRITLVDGTNKTYEGDTYIVKGRAAVKGCKKENGFYISDKYFTVAGKKFKVETSKVNIEIEISEINY